MSLRTGWLLLIALGFYAAVQSQFDRSVRKSLAPELLVTFPRPVQVAMAAGDRYLAANLAGFRVLVADTTRMTAADFSVQARLQTDLSWLNPYHEDNYYIAAALLPWNGHLDAAQYVLSRASEVRRNDYQPLFYYAFNTYHFQRNPAKASELLLQGVERATDQQDQWALQNLAAIWIERGYQTQAAAGIVNAMANNSPPGAFKSYLKKRGLRLEQLAKLQNAVEEYKRIKGNPPTSLNQLLDAGILPSLPVDPLGQGYMLTAEGDPVFRR